MRSNVYPQGLFSNDPNMEPGSSHLYPQPSAPAYDYTSASALPPAYSATPVVYSPYANLPRAIAENMPEVNMGLKACGLEKHKAKVALVLDISGSMEDPNKYFSSGAVAELVTKAVALAASFDDDGDIEIFPFGKKCHDPITVSIKDFQKFSADTIVSQIMHKIGGFEAETNYGAAVEKLRRHYFNNGATGMKKPEGAALPVFAIFVTDGDCNEHHQISSLEQFRASSYQPIFFKFLALAGNGKNAANFDFLQNSIDDDPVTHDSYSWKSKIGSTRYMDNSDLVVLRNPKELEYKSLLHEYREYLAESYYEKDLLSANPGVEAVRETEHKSSGRVVGQHTAKLADEEASLSGWCNIL